jgi:hypothetical protein
MEIVKRSLKIQPKKKTNILSSFDCIIVLDGQFEVTFSLNMYAAYLNVSAKVASGDDGDDVSGVILGYESLQFCST